MARISACAGFTESGWPIRSPQVRASRVFGKVELERSRADRLMVQPELEILSDDDDDEETLHSGRVVGVYEAAGKISTRVFRSLFNRVLDEVYMPADALPESVREPSAIAGARRAPCAIFTSPAPMLM